MNASAGVAPDVALIGGNVIDVRTGSALLDAAVVIVDGRIAQVTPAAGLRLPQGCERVDVRGAWLMPGLSDMHAHIVIGSWQRLLPVFLAYGVTTIREPGAPLTKAQLLRDEVRSGARLSPRMFIAGPILDGNPPIWHDLGVMVDTDARAETAVRFLHASDVDAIKVLNFVPERSLEIIVKTAHELGLPVMGHVPRWMTMTRAVEIGMDSLEHTRVTAREILATSEAEQLDYLPARQREALIWDRFDPSSPAFERLARHLAAHRVFLDPTFVQDFGPLRTDDERARAARSVDMPAWVVEGIGSWAPPSFMTISADLLEMGRAGFPKRLRWVKLCADAGVRLLTGTDRIGPGDDLPGMGIQNEMAYFVEAGLTPLQAIQASTINAAQALGRERELGTIEAGKLADLLVLDADPRADIRNARRIRNVVFDGRVTTPAELLAAPPVEPVRPDYPAYPPQLVAT